MPLCLFALSVEALSGEPLNLFLVSLNAYS